MRICLPKEQVRLKLKLQWTWIHQNFSTEGRLKFFYSSHSPANLNLRIFNMIPKLKSIKYFCLVKFVIAGQLQWNLGSVQDQNLYKNKIYSKTTRTAQTKTVLNTDQYKTHTHTNTLIPDLRSKQGLKNTIWTFWKEKLKLSRINNTTLKMACCNRHCKTFWFLFSLSAGEFFNQLNRFFKKNKNKNHLNGLVKKVLPLHPPDKIYFLAPWKHL